MRVFFKGVDKHVDSDCELIALIRAERSIYILYADPCVFAEESCLLEGRWHSNIKISGPLSGSCIFNDFGFRSCRFITDKEN